MLVVAPVVSVADRVAQVSVNGVGEVTLILFLPVVTFRSTYCLAYRFLLGLGRCWGGQLEVQ